jgi:hypothetical protein
MSNGLELAREYYFQCGKNMLEAKFPAYRSRIACGLAGEGSDCLGYDDLISQDHDFGPGFCMWLTDEDERQIGDALRTAYMELPDNFMGYRARDPYSYGEQRLSAMRISNFYRRFTDLSQAPTTLEEWRRIPENFMSTATGGAIFIDELGEFTKIREILLGFYPEDIRLKKIAARAAVMAQAGQYNYERCLRRREEVAAHGALAEFVNATCSIIYLLNKKYTPFYKWAHRGLKNMTVGSETSILLAELCGNATPARRKLALIEDICGVVVKALQVQKLTDANNAFLAAHCPEIMKRICDDKIRQMHIMAE